jgi:hypothetical protein
MINKGWSFLSLGRSRMRKKKTPELEMGFTCTDPDCVPELFVPPIA